jgi:hypothetical protein
VVCALWRCVGAGLPGTLVDVSGFYVKFVDEVDEWVFLVFWIFLFRQFVLEVLDHIQECIRFS